VSQVVVSIAFVNAILVVIALVVFTSWRNSLEETPNLDRRDIENIASSDDEILHILSIFYRNSCKI